MLESGVGVARQRLEAARVVRRGPVVGLLRDQLSHDRPPLVEPARLPVRVSEGERVPTAGIERLAHGAANGEDDGAVLLGDRRAEDLGRYEDERPGASFGRVLADRERRAPTHDDVQLLVAAVLLVRRDQLTAGVCAPSIDARGPEAERVADGDEVAAAMRRRLDLVEREDHVAPAHALADRSASSTTGSIASFPSTR